MPNNKQSTRSFWLGVTGETLHAVVSIIEEETVAQRAACGSRLLEDDEPCIPYTCRAAAFQVINFNKKTCKRCAAIDPNLVVDLRKEVKFWLTNPEC